MELPDTFWHALQLVGGFAAFVIGISFAFKFVQAAFEGKVAYWGGLEPFQHIWLIVLPVGWAILTPITLFISPLFIHLPFDPKKSLCKWRQQLWVHLFFGPVFFILSLMFMTSGADLMGLPGSSSLNFILTLNRPDIPPCIVYNPPYSYKFPFAKKAAKTVYKFLTTKIPTKKEDSYNAFEQRGDDVDEFSGANGKSWFDDDDKPAVQPASNVTPAPSKGKHK